jgi:hypothetical protein
VGTAKRDIASSDSRPQPKDECLCCDSHMSGGLATGERLTLRLHLFGMLAEPLHPCFLPTACGKIVLYASRCPIEATCQYFDQTSSLQGQLLLVSTTSRAMLHIIRGLIDKVEVII